MNISNPGKRLELLAASYALGTLRGGARRRFETLAREQAPVRAAALIWQGRLSSLTEIEPGVKPDAAVWAKRLSPSGCRPASLTKLAMVNWPISWNSSAVPMRTLT